MPMGDRISKTKCSSVAVEMKLSMSVNHRRDPLSHELVHVNRGPTLDGLALSRAEFWPLGRNTSST